MNTLHNILFQGLSYLTFTPSPNPTESESTSSASSSKLLYEVPKNKPLTRLAAAQTKQLLQTASDFSTSSSKGSQEEPSSDRNLRSKRPRVIPNEEPPEVVDEPVLKQQKIRVLSIEKRVTRASKIILTEDTSSKSSSSTNGSLLEAIPESPKSKRSSRSSPFTEVPQESSKTSVRELGRNFQQPLAEPNRVHKTEFQTILSQYDCDTEISVEELNQYRTELSQTGLTNGLLLCEIDPTTVGSGLFLDPEATPIEKGTFLGLYSGKMMITTEKTISKSAYLLTLLPEIELTNRQIESLPNDPSDEDLYYLDIDADKTGNFTRYFNDSGHAKKCNVIWKRVWIPSLKTMQIGFFASERILPGQQALISYGKKYWEPYRAMGIVPASMTPTTYILNDKYRLVKGSR